MQTIRGTEAENRISESNEEGNLTVLSLVQITSSTEDDMVILSLISITVGDENYPSTENFP